VAGLSLTHTVGKAVWAGLFTSGNQAQAQQRYKLSDDPFGAQKADDLALMEASA